MTDLRESHIIVDSGSINSETANLKLAIKANVGLKQHEDNMNKIKAFGIEPTENVLVVDIDFISDEAANNAATKISEVYEKVLPKLVPIPPIWNAPKVQGSVVILSFKVPEQYAGQFVILEPIIAALGELTSTDQYFEVDITGFAPGKETFAGAEAAAPTDPATKIGSFIKVALVTHKDLPKKVIAVAEEMGAASPKLTRAGAILSSLKHIRVDAKFEDYDEHAKEEFKNKVKVVALAIGAGLEPLGLVDIAKTIKGNITGTLCISSAISFTFKIFVPTLPEILEAANP